MSESDMAIIKPEMMKSYIWLQTTDGSLQQVELEVAMFCPTICQEVIQQGTGSSKTHPISLPQRVNTTMLSLILDYCRFHQAPGRSNKERKSYDEKFIKMDTKKICELTSAADSLQLNPLVDLTSRALARMIEGKSPEEIRNVFHLPDDLTEEEKLEPLRNITDDPRIRLLNRLYARKRKELKEKEKPKNVDGEEGVDDRSVDDLLSFINGDSKDVRVTKSKKKNRRRKDCQKNILLPAAMESHVEDSNGVDHPQANLDSVCGLHENNNCIPTSSEISNSSQAEDGAFASRSEFEDGDIDDEIDPELKEEIDREVEDFARRLNLDWPERMQMQEVLSLDQKRRLMSGAVNGNGARRYASKFTKALLLTLSSWKALG